MGASIGMAHGISKVFKPDSIKNKTVAVIGDSTFFHSGVTGLLNMVYNKGTSVVIVMDNRTTAMTGGQDHPGTGQTLMGEPAIETDILKLAKTIGVKNVKEIDTYNLKETEETIKEALEKDELTVLVCKRPCALKFKVVKPALKVDEEKCVGCKSCLKVGCIALSVKDVEGETKAYIDPSLCVGCGVCAQVCKFDVIGE
jgi:indolepyruvate ferredoxin oxidoreductase alpha subunit